jgi:hypothetical protein
MKAVVKRSVSRSRLGWAVTEQQEQWHEPGNRPATAAVFFTALSRLANPAKHFLSALALSCVSHSVLREALS